MRSIWCVAVLVATSAMAGDEISINELELMTVPELAEKAYAECTAGAEERGEVNEAIRRMRDNTGAPAIARSYAQISGQHAETLGEHRDNLKRIRLVVRAKLNGDEPAWITTLSAGTSEDDCREGRGQYANWHPASPTAPPAAAKRPAKRPTPRAK